MKTIKNLTADEIRKSILQLAIQGKLVKQNPDDEPASELVKKIYAEKKRLIAEGKIKKDKNESFIFKGDDNCYYEKIGKNEPVKLENLPFDIPESWTWIRLENTSQLLGGYAFKSEKFSKEGVRVIRISDFDENGIKNKDIKRYPYSPDLSSYQLKENDILMCMTGGTVGKSSLIKHVNEPMYINQRVAMIRIDYVNLYYFYHVLLSSYISNVIHENKTSTNDNISMKLIEDFLIPLPPLEEQQRIVDKINSFEPLLQEYDTYEKRLSKLEEEFPEKLKKSILQYAIEGKLVKQDPNDEPASALLERIKAEKEALIKAGKIKRDKNELYIYQGDDKNYYENLLPNGWVLTTISAVISLTSGNDLEPNEYSPKNIGIPYITGASNITNSGEIIINRFTYSKYKNSSSGSILLTCKGTIGKIAVNVIGDTHVARQIMSIKSFVNQDYMKYCLLNIVNELNREARSMIPGIDRKQLLSKKILLPPLKEQIHISKKLSFVFELISN